jgi:serine/threonine protein kinase
MANESNPLSEHKTAVPGQPNTGPIPLPSEAAGGLPANPHAPTVPGGLPAVDTHGSNPAPGSLLGTTFGDFEVIAEIGRGGMGVVYKARQVSLDRLVAVKVLLRGSFTSQTVLARFLAEARAAAALSHPNIVTIYQVGECPVGHFFAMEFIDGQSLEDILQKGPVPIAWGANLIGAVADAVNYAHGKGIIHRDLKPGNIMIDRLRRPVVMDFGIAKLVGGENAGLTQQGEIIGTPAFMAPEQARSGAVPIAPYTDVYSLGAILYTMVAGRYPFHEETTLDTLLKVISPEPPPPLRDLRPDVPEALERICLKCLAKAPADRYQTARALAEDLRRFRTSLSGVRPTDRASSGSARINLPSVLLVSPKSGKEVRLFSGTVTIGRSPECDLKMKASDVSKKHCQLIIDQDKVVVEDLNSANGTYVNDERVQRRRLKDGDRLGIAGHDFEVRIPRRS